MEILKCFRTFPFPQNFEKYLILDIENIRNVFFPLKYSIWDSQFHTNNSNQVCDHHSKYSNKLTNLSLKFHSARGEQHLSTANATLSSNFS